MCEKSKFIRSYEKMVWGRLFSFDSIAFGKHWKYIVLLRSAKCPFVCKRCLVCTSPQVNRLFIFVYLFGFFFSCYYIFMCVATEKRVSSWQNNMFFIRAFFMCFHLPMIGSSTSGLRLQSSAQWLFVIIIMIVLCAFFPLSILSICYSNGNERWASTHAK